MKKTRWLVCILFAVLTLTACSTSKSPLQAIRDRNMLRVGVKTDVLNFGYLNPKTNELEGLEIDLAKLIAKEIFGNEKSIKMVGVTAQTRETMLKNGELDIVIATFTITEERKKAFHFSAPYYHDAIGFLVRKDSGLSSFEDLNGKTIGIAQFGTAHSALMTEAEARGITLQYQQFASYPEIMAALSAGRVDAFSVDKSILTGYRNEDTLILDVSFNPQDYGIAVNKDNAAFAKYLDELMATIEKDGRLEEILSRWDAKTEE